LLGKRTKTPQSNGWLALYGSFAIATNSTFGRTVLPLG
jgi:hypothetical protein